MGSKLSLSVESYMATEMDLLREARKRHKRHNGYYDGLTFVRCVQCNHVYYVLNGQMFRKEIYTDELDRVPITETSDTRLG